VFVKVTACNTQAELDEVISGMDQAMRDWTKKAARMECGWICADCCSSDNRGMPVKCMHGQQFCTDINTRDKRLAYQEVNTKE